MWTTSDEYVTNMICMWTHMWLIGFVCGLVAINMMTDRIHMFTNME